MSAHNFKGLGYSETAMVTNSAQSSARDPDIKGFALASLSFRISSSSPSAFWSSLPFLCFIPGPGPQRGVRPFNQISLRLPQYVSSSASSALCPWFSPRLLSVSSRTTKAGSTYSVYALLLPAISLLLPALCASFRTGFDGCGELFGFGATKYKCDISHGWTIPTASIPSFLAGGKPTAWRSRMRARVCVCALALTAWLTRASNTASATARFFSRSLWLLKPRWGPHTALALFLAFIATEELQWVIRCYGPPMLWLWRAVGLWHVATEGYINLLYYHRCIAKVVQYIPPHARQIR
ncbi:hypothetical protein B0H19DRAFT_1081648 [Mycena capillaripes]|nr:hypothetical protein B0H19DRAFT_1081648 [Mycena capillaripes]